MTKRNVFKLSDKQKQSSEMGKIIPKRRKKGQNH